MLNRQTSQPSDLAHDFGRAVFVGIGETVREILAIEIETAQQQVGH